MARVESKKLKGDKRYADAPRFKVTYGYEDSFKNMFKKASEQMVKDIVITAQKIVRKK